MLELFQVLSGFVHSDLYLHVIFLQLVKVRRPTLLQYLEVILLRVHLVYKRNCFRELQTKVVQILLIHFVYIKVN